MSDIYNKNRIRCQITSNLLPLYTVITNLTVSNIYIQETLAVYGGYIPEKFPKW
jgi:hypothetical protein